MGLGPCDEAGMRQADTDSGCADRLKPYVLTVAILGSSMAFVDGTVVTVALPAIARGLGAGLADLQWIANGYALCLAALMLIGGAAGDRFGRRRVFALGTAVFAAASLWCGLASSPGELIAARAVQGMGGALLVPNSLALISGNFPKAERGRAIGIWAAWSSIAAAFGPILGGWLIEAGSWRLIFLINIPIAVVTLALAFARVPESRDQTAAGGLDWTGAVLVAAGLGAVAYALTVWGETQARGTGLMLVALAGVAALAAFTWMQGRAANPMMPLALFRSPAFSVANALTLVLYFALGGVLFFMPMTLIEVHGYSTSLAGAAFLPFTALMALLSGWAGGLLDRYGARLPLVVGPIIAGLGFAALAPWPVGVSFWVGVVPAMALTGLGMAITVAPLSATVMNAVADSQAGVASGINNTVARVAGLLAVAGFGIVVTSVFEQSATALAQTAGVEAAQAMTTLSFAGDAAVTGDGAAIRRAALLDSFRSVALIAAGLAIVSAALAGLALKPARQASSTPP